MPIDEPESGRFVRRLMGVGDDGVVRVGGEVGRADGDVERIVADENVEVAGDLLLGIGPVLLHVNSDGIDVLKSREVGPSRRVRGDSPGAASDL